MFILMYANNKVATFINESLGNSPSWQLVQKKNWPETNGWIILAVRWFWKYFFAPNSPLFQKRGGEKKKRDSYEEFFFSSKRKNNILS